MPRHTAEDQKGSPPVSICDLAFQQPQRTISGVAAIEPPENTPTPDDVFAQIPAKTHPSIDVFDVIEGRGSLARAKPAINAERRTLSTIAVYTADFAISFFSSRLVVLD